MKNRNTTITLVAGFAAIMLGSAVKAGNPTRTGQSGASELLIDPWAGTSGFAGANTSCVQGIESQFLNVAGTAFTQHTEVIVGTTNYLGGSGINLDVAGLCQHVGDAGAIGITVTSLNLGSIPITTYDNPDGGIGNYSPQFINIGLSYARGFSDNIYGGLNLKLISESVTNVSALGVAIDAGIQYVADVAGAKKNLHFGISLKNVGPPMKYTGDGLATDDNLPNGNSGSITLEQRSQEFELPSLVNIGAAYDFHIHKDSSGVSMHRITVAGNFTSNSFTEDEEELGVEYGFKNIFSVRVGFDYEKGLFGGLSTDLVNTTGRLTVYTGPCAGFTLQLPFGKAKGSSFGVSYAYRASNPYTGSNTISVRMSL